MFTRFSYLKKSDNIYSSESGLAFINNKIKSLNLMSFKKYVSSKNKFSFF